ncbi:MAG: hypothetical protein RIQ81_632 [Pseudomonadota bacterium]
MPSSTSVIRVRMRLVARVCFFGASWLACASQAAAVEHTRTLPRGRFNLNLRSVATDIAHKTGSSGAREGLAAPLERDLTFNDVLRNQGALSAVRAAKVEGFMLANDFAREDSLGKFSASAKASVRATAPVLAYGVTDRFTVAAGAPYINARSAISVAFTRSGTAGDFIARLSDPANNQLEAALELEQKLSDAPAELNRELVNYGVAPLGEWQGSGWGDTTLATKWRAWESGPLSFAATAGHILATGAPDDPRIMTDVPFGDGQSDTFIQGTAAQEFVRGMTVSETLKYTYQHEGRREVFRGMDPEDLEAGTVMARFKPGDRIDAALGCAWNHVTGMNAAAGWQVSRKWSDRYYDEDDGRRLEKLAAGTDQTLHVAELVAGFSTVEGFLRGDYVAPAEISLAVQRQISSRNAMESDLYEMSASLFF